MRAVASIGILWAIAGCDGTNGGVSVDAPGIDTSVDASQSDCPVRTVAAGQPQGTVSLSAVKNGNYRISSQLDIDALAGIRVITGDLTVSTPAFDVLTLPELEVVGGNFFIQDFAPRLTQIALPALESVGGTMEWSSQAAVTGLQRLDSGGSDFHVGVRSIPTTLSCLRSLGNRLDLISMADTTSVSLPRLETVGVIDVRNNAVLTTIALPSLTTATNISVTDSPQLTSFSAPTLSQTGVVEFRMDPLLAETRFDNLTNAVSIHFGSTLDVKGFPKLVTLTGGLFVSLTSATTLATFSKLTTASNVGIGTNAQLANLGLAALTTLTSTMMLTPNSIQNNALLPTCQATQLRDRVMKPFMISGNNDAGTCP